MIHNREAIPTTHLCTFKFRYTCVTLHVLRKLKNWTTFSGTNYQNKKKKNKCVTTWVNLSSIDRENFTSECYKYKLMCVIYQKNVDCTKTDNYVMDTGNIGIFLQTER